MQNIAKYFVVLILGLLTFLTTVDVFAQTTLDLSTYAGSPLSNTDRSGLYDRILTEAFNRIGVKIEITHLPAERSLKNANMGITDGDFVRISGLEKLYPNLVRVPEKIIDFEFVAFSKEHDIKIVDWESCKPFHVGIVRGWKILENNLAEVASLTRVKNQKLLFKLLERNRVDLIVYSRLEGYEVMRQLGMKHIKVFEPPLAVREMFLYLNKKHKSLIPQVDQALKGLKRDGTYEKFVNDTINRYLPSEKIESPKN